MSEAKPWHDTPLCPRPTSGKHAGGSCMGPLIPKRAADWNHRAAPDERLVCCSCGNGQVGTDAEVEQAERAQKAWDAEEARQTPAQGCAELCDFEPCREAGECDG